VSSDPTAKYPAEKGRYLLYVNFGCPWAHRTIITRALKGLQEVIELIEVGDLEPGKGWVFNGPPGPDKDPRYGFKYLRELYDKADPNYDGRITVPVLWDTKTETIVNNESSEIIRIFYTAFDEFLPEEKREATKGEAGLFPEHLRGEIDAMNDWVYNTINNGVYKCGFAGTQEAYETHVYALFESLDRLEEHLSYPEHQPFLFGKHITEADIRLYTTLARFDVAYYPIFLCNLKMIRHDYPNLHKWLRTLYWDPEGIFGGAFKNTTRFSDVGLHCSLSSNRSLTVRQYKKGYTRAAKGKIVPAGPVPDILPL
jgi:putative glutathione S-transferase